MRRKTNILGLLDKRVPPGKKLLIKTVSEEAEKAGKVFIAGGFVRDLLLGIPVSDMDIAVEGDARKLGSSVESRLGGKLVYHQRFGTATVFFGKGSRLDIATAREEKYPRPAALPEVVSSSIYNDLRRRDFTVNALAISLNPSSRGELIDCFGGLDDLRNKTIRVIHDDSFRDDPTRIFRAVRFSHRLGFQIDKKTAALISEAVSGRYCAGLSGRRLRNEIELLFSEADSAGAAARMEEYGIQECISPGIKLDAHKIEFIREADEFAGHAKEANFPGNFKIWLVRFIALLCGLDKEELKAVSKRLMLGNREARAAISLPRAEAAAKKLNSVEKPAPSGVYSLIGSLPPEAAVLCAAAMEKKRRAEIVGIFKNAASVRLETTGSDLIRMGFSPGPAVKAALDEIRTKKIDGVIKNRQDEINFAGRLRGEN